MNKPHHPELELGEHTQKHQHRQFTEPIFSRLAEYRASLAEHPLLTAAQKGQLSRPILDELAFYQYSDSILWIPMLAQMKSGALRSQRLKQAIEDNIAHEAGIGSTSHVILAARLMRSLGISSLEHMPTRTFTKSAELWLSDEFAVTFNEAQIAGWLLTAETLVPQMFAAVVDAYEAIEGCDVRYFHEHIHVDSDEHATWMAEAVEDIVTLYGPSAVADVLEGMRDAWEETREVPDALWRKARRVLIAYNACNGSDVEGDAPETIAMLRVELAALGHDVEAIDVNASLVDVLPRFSRGSCSVVLNLAEGTRGVGREAMWPALYDALGVAYTGSDACTLAVCLDKRLTKRIVASAGIDVPRDSGERVIVKPNAQGSSIGITQQSVCDGSACGDVSSSDMLVEEFIDGIDVSVPFVEALGGVLPPVSYEYDGDVLDFELKQHAERVRIHAPARLDDDVTARVMDAARTAFDVLRVRGWGRADFRVTRDGRVVFLEMNPLPSLAASDPELFMSAALRGFTKRDVIAAIVG